MMKLAIAITTATLVVLMLAFLTPARGDTLSIIGSTGIDDFYDLGLTDYLTPETTLIMDSPGGNPYKAMLIGLATHEAGATVVVRDRCWSACTLVLDGAQHRIMEPGANLGFHRWARIDGGMVDHDGVERILEAYYFLVNREPYARIGLYWSAPADEITVIDHRRAYILDLTDNPPR